MAGQLMLINPRKRHAKRKATPTQLRNLAKARAARSASLATNPAPRKYRTLRAVAPHAKRRVRRNPIGSGGVMGQLTDAGMGAIGAVGVNVIFGMLPIPASLTSSAYMKEATKMALAVGLGVATRKMLGRKGAKMVEGALTVSAFNILQSVMPSSLGGTPAPATATVAGLGFMSPGYNAGGALPFQNQSVTMNGLGDMGQYATGLGDMGQYVY